ncbi:flagellar biosynthetic protein FliO [Xenorhabdus szentirmaii]|uniref:Flagellar protein n=1 Tax=Xenorhabdus szentirmaii DSM 16338 TaxID=1427518 RepID=W1J3I3_9GAMM|nr:MULTISPECIES: flagellar biosynthetic protein FliO [Xenorhabdus]MBD2821531.1 flagellar biosynthetic protein FliO [Xenorhabdus sp. 42]PHM31923.1 flagellar biosynthesis protein FliO [Xenorhabdus szentirmaii DSM 16338]CDL85327.1 Flagellar biosynthesis [Xenorhabdus szentirmaii DSM 16338]
MMANQPSLHVSAQRGTASDAVPVSTIVSTVNSTVTSATNSTNSTFNRTETGSTAPLPASQTLMQVSTALGGILLLIFFITWLVRRLGLAPAKNKNHRLLNIKASCSLGPKERVVVVEIEDNWLVLGVTAQQINMLHQMPAPLESAEKDTALKSVSFGQMFKNTLQRKSKKDKDDNEK